MYVGYEFRIIRTTYFLLARNAFSYRAFQLHNDFIQYKIFFYAFANFSLSYHLKWIRNTRMNNLTVVGGSRKLVYGVYLELDIDQISRLTPRNDRLSLQAIVKIGSSFSLLLIPTESI